MIKKDTGSYRYKYVQYRDAFPKWKLDKCGIISRYIHRPISFAVSAFFSNVGFTPNQVSFLALIVAICTCFVFLIPSSYAYFTGAVLMNVWLVLDCADGNMARVLGGQPYGEFADATSSYFLYGFLFPAMGMASCRIGGVIFPEGDYIVAYIGAMASGSTLMSKLYYHKAMDMEYLSEGKLNSIRGNGRKGNSKISKIYNTISDKFLLGEWDMVFVVVAVMMKAMDLFILIFFLYFFVEFIASFSLIIKKTGILTDRMPNAKNAIETESEGGKEN